MELGAFSPFENEIVHKNRGCCGPVAISRAFGKSLSDSLDLCKSKGYYCSRRGGMWDVPMHMVIEELVGSPVRPSIEVPCTHRCEDFVSPTPTLTKFCLANPTGTFIIMVRGHYVVVRDGKVIDPLFDRVRRRRGDRRKVIMSWKVG